ALRSSAPTATIIGRRHRIDRFILPSLDRASHWYSCTKPPAQDRRPCLSCQALYQPLPVHVVSSWSGSAGFHMDHSEERVVLSMDHERASTSTHAIMDKVREMDLYPVVPDRKSTRLNSSHRTISYA